MYNRKLVFYAACLGMLVFGIVMISLGTINTFLTAKFNLNELTVGTLASLLPFGILIGSLVFGPVVDRYGYKYLLIVCSTFIGLALILIASTKTFGLIQAAFFLIGFGGGAINGGTNALVADISTENKGANLSLLGVFYGVGALGMPSAIGLLSNLFSYERIIFGIGVFVIVLVAGFCSIKFPEPKQAQGFPLRQGLSLLKNPVLVLIGFILFFESGIEGVTNNWTTTYLQQHLAVSAKDALLALPLLVLGLTLARLVLGGVLKKLSAYIVLIGCLLSALLGVIILMIAGSYTLAVTGLVLLGIGFAAGFPVILGYVGQLFESLSGTAFSIVLVIALLGNTLLNSLVGLIAHSFGIQHYLSILLGSIIAMLILLSIVLPKISKKIKI